MTDTILLTGATGFLGTELAARLVRQSQIRIYALVRAGGYPEACHRLREAWQHDDELYAAVGLQVRPVPGDFTLPGLGLDPEYAAELQKEVTLVIHAGAEVGFEKSTEALKRTNTEGTGQMLLFASGIGRLRRFIHISTAYVAGQSKGTVMETEPVTRAFSSYYEQSKAEAESLVRASGLPFSICRPGMIVGDSQTGWVRNFNTVYYILRLMLLGQMRLVPVSAGTLLNIVPGDYVADSVIKIAGSGEAEGKTFHLTCPADAAPSAGELAAYVRTWAEKELGESIPAPVFVPLPFLKQAGLSHNAKGKNQKKSFWSNLLTLMPYFFGKQVFDRTNTDRICGPYEQDWHGYIDRLLAFACRKNFMRQTGRSVFEQAMIRRESSRYPIYYYDIRSDGITQVTGPEVNRRIRQALAALRAWGVRKGDRIALTGINSTDYLVLEQAIGLTGAVSVPIYYTTPVQEASLLLSRSGAKWFFIGDRRMMENPEALETDARIVAFSVGETLARGRVMRWEEFLKKAEAAQDSGGAGGQVKAAQDPDAGVQPSAFRRQGNGEARMFGSQKPEPDELATIRYTSGTTGEPKGVMFSFGQLAWMGEVLTNLLTWKERNRSMCYLSFLPLSHVVEGILASYAPYYVRCRVDYYYLNDFGALTDALPKVRPTVFFSVPRFYEKLWSQVTANRIGRTWMSMKDGPARAAVGAVLKKAVLKKAGLDRCSQLIVGSAPVSEALLLQFRALGIEIYNAYGQTEAPLITINRLGDNVIPTIGTPLPDTQVTAEDDGELIVKGPQVALGYYGLETDTIRDGVLRTGDLGIIHDNGHITLHGRKKDMIVTAYGKNISIPKLEERLKDIPGVSEAVLIGENRPYCTALLWLEKEVPDLEDQIARMNEKLSHPEQIRRYRVIDRPLSIQAEELTPNLKVRRANVQAHLAEEIEEMYR